MSKDSIKHFYDDKYQDYRNPPPKSVVEHLYAIFKKYELHRSEMAVRLLEPGNSILDVGVGFGDVLIKAHDKGYQQLYGIDISSVVIKKCRQILQKKRLPANLSVQNIDQVTTFKAKSFDAVTILAVFEHIFNPHSVLTELHRLLKPGGILVIEVPNVAFLPRRISFLLGGLPKTGDEPIYQDGHLQFFTQHTLTQLLNEHGFDVEWRGSSGIGYQWRNIWPQLLGANIVIKARKRL